MPRIQDVLISKENNYTIKQHYEYFMCEKNMPVAKNNKNTNKEKIKKNVIFNI